MTVGCAGVPGRPPTPPVVAVALVAVLAGLLAAGCAGSGAPPLEPRLRDEVTIARVHLVATLEREATRPDQALVANFHLTNQGPPLLYEEGGCASAPWTFEVRAEDGTLVAPLGPAPDCEPKPPQRRGIPTGEALSHAFSWDANVKRYAEDGSILRTPAEPGLYQLRAEVLVTRDGAPIRPAVELVFRVLAPADE